MLTARVGSRKLELFASKAFFKMKKLLCVVPALVLSAMISAPNARADSYAATFTCYPGPPLQGPFSGCPLGTVPTAPDVLFPAPTTIDVTIGASVVGTIFDVSLANGDSPTDSYSYYFGFGGPNPGPGPVYVGSLTVQDLTTGLSSTTTEPMQVDTDNFYGGTLSFSPASAATPEPAPLILMALGAGLIFFIRKRFTMRVPHTV